MNKSNQNYLLTLLLVFCALNLFGNYAASGQAGRAASAKTSNKVCPDLKKPCHHREREFESWEMPFHLPARIKANVNYKSAAFYAVIIKKIDEGCGELDFDPAVEKERARLQKLFPARKVFAEYSCPNMDAVGYDFAGKTDSKGEHVLYMDYIAVYAGETADEAKQLFDEVRVKFPKAEVKKMTANYTRIEQ